MEEADSIKKSEPKPRRRITTLRLVVCGVLADVIGHGLSWWWLTPGAWSDYHSQWMGPFVGAVVCLMLFVATHWIWDQSRLQACFLWLVFGGYFIASLSSLAQSQQWCRECGRAGPLDYFQHPSWFFDRTYHEVPKDHK